jgi:hypothetical protein
MLHHNSLTFSLRAEAKGKRQGLFILDARQLATENTENTEKENHSSLLLLPSAFSVFSVAKKTEGVLTLRQTRLSVAPLS